MNNKKTIIFLSIASIVFVATIVGISVFKSSNTNTSDYIYYIAWNNIIYGLSDDVLEINQIGNTLGETKRLISGSKPQFNGDVARVTPEGPEGIPVGSKLLELKNISSKQAIAVYINNKYLKLNKTGLLK